MNKKTLAITSVLLALFALVSSCLFVVDQRQFAIVYEADKVQRVIAKPGLEAKLPWPLQLVKTIDKRVITSDGDGGKPVPTADKQTVLPDWYVRWRIADVQQYLQQVGNTEKAGQALLDQAVFAALKAELARNDLSALMSEQRTAIMHKVRLQVQAATQGAGGSQPWGVQVLDVHITRMDVNKAATEAIYSQMRTQSQHMAATLRATGQAEAEKIRTEADLQTLATLTQGYSDAEQIKGQGDAEASRIYAESYAKDPQFASFYRALAVYRRSFNSKSDVLVIDPANDALLKAIRQGGSTAVTASALPAPATPAAASVASASASAAPAAPVAVKR